MQLNPRYDDVPPVDVLAEPAAIRQPFLSQRRRLAATVATLTDEQLATPSRCEGWTVANVLTHLIDVDGFWAFSMASGIAGAPSRVLASFDPEATPREMVASKAGMTPQDVRATFASTTAALCDAVDGLDDDAWNCTAEAPPGHVTLVTMVHHALWDCWIHERDIGLPLGLDVVEDDAEIAAALAYAVGLSPSFGVWADESRSGQLGIVATDPDVELLVDIGRTVTVSRGSAPADAPTLTGRAIDLTEGLSQRSPLAHGLPADQHWMVDGLAEVFASTPP